MTKAGGDIFQSSPSKTNPKNKKAMIKDMKSRRKSKLGDAFISRGSLG